MRKLARSRPPLPAAEQPGWAEAEALVSYQTARELDQSNWSALHFAVVYAAPASLVALLLMTWPDGAKQRAGEGRYGRLPLQLAVTRKATAPEVVLRLLEAYPEAVNAANPADGKTVRCPQGLQSGPTAPQQSS